MDIAEIKVKQKDLKRNMETLIKKFIDETGCIPNVDVDYMKRDVMGSPTQYIPSITVNSVIR